MDIALLAFIGLDEHSLALPDGEQVNAFAGADEFPESTFFERIQRRLWP